ncbi:hypothetical protein BDB01DRAFT_896960 [Pilobolus umbonatus]|nr:hypothetical protein BDB01DRAFT_896960 [Pilobolus umbonatus]
MGLTRMGSKRTMKAICHYMSMPHSNTYFSSGRHTTVKSGEKQMVCIIPVRYGTCMFQEAQNLVLLFFGDNKGIIQTKGYNIEHMDCSSSSFVWVIHSSQQQVLNITCIYTTHMPTSGQLLPTLVPQMNRFSILAQKCTVAYLNRSLKGQSFSV